MSASTSNSTDSSLEDSFFKEKQRKVKAKERSILRNSKKLIKNEEKIIKIRIDIMCPNLQNYFDQIDKGLSLRKIFIEIDKSDTKSIKNHSEEDSDEHSVEEYDDNSSNIHNINDILKPNYSLNPTIPRSKTDVNFIQIGGHDLNKRRSSLQHNQYSALLKYPRELLQKFLFKSKRTVKLNSFTGNVIEKSGDSVTEIVYYEHQAYAGQNTQNHIKAQTLTNPKLSIGISRDPDSIANIKEKLSENQRLVKSKRLIFDFTKMEEINKSYNPSTYFTYFRYPYTKICELDYSSLMLNVINPNYFSKPSQFELSNGNSNCEIGINLWENTRYESFHTYLPLYIQFKVLDMSNDEIIDFISQNLIEKMLQMNQELIDYINLKFPLDFLFYNAGRKSPSTKDLSIQTQEPEFYLLAYQVLDEKFEPLEKELIELVKINYSTMYGTDAKSIKKAIHSAIGDQAESYSCNFFRMWHYVILIKQPRINLDLLLKNN
ncbi:hypothetical protein BpHYR1_045189, partial [Brachionus plicatilis]